MGHGFWLTIFLKGVQLISSHFCSGYPPAVSQERQQRLFCAPFKRIISISLALCSAPLYCCDFSDVRPGAVLLPQTWKKGRRGDTWHPWVSVLVKSRVFLTCNWYYPRVSPPFLLLRRHRALHPSWWGCWQSFVICRATAAGSEANEQQRRYADMTSLLLPLSLFVSLRLLMSFPCPRSPVISLSALPTPLFLEQVVPLGESMKLCVCEPAEHSESHSCVRHSRRRSCDNGAA